MSDSFTAMSRTAEAERTRTGAIAATPAAGAERKPSMADNIEQIRRRLDRKRGEGISLSAEEAATLKGFLTVYLKGLQDIIDAGPEPPPEQTPAATPAPADAPVAPSEGTPPPTATPAA